LISLVGGNVPSNYILQCQNQRSSLQENVGALEIGVQTILSYVWLLRLKTGTAWWLKQLLVTPKVKLITIQLLLDKNHLPG